MCVFPYSIGSTNTGICTDRYAITCSELVPCEHSTNLCNQTGYKCVHHPQCGDFPVCYPIPSFNQQLCSPITTTISATSTITSATTIRQLGKVLNNITTSFQQFHEFYVNIQYD
ncbi:unnamed protein product [Rotaria magnacalcarata]|uniref:Uncharacterized protein n=1 Tax=Rotaria magnacalcarata TaxID=392030 RepID=A0A8S2JB64_9BILA|nr:unnamed protein product [Rotaria magnacalcarata]CAF4262288.1 unnamed protein product [Rotaria magnacalcarata]